MHAVPGAEHASIIVVEEQKILQPQVRPV